RYVVIWLIFYDGTFTRKNSAALPSALEEPPKMTSEGFFRRKLCHLVGGHCCAAWRTRSTITELLSSSMRQTIT
ncbi:hypothetical protein KKJ26_17310, partial [Xenorhabdus bovienii]|nr:hypothetical protein [Xenorhabdus bovienii]